MDLRDSIDSINTATRAMLDVPKDRVDALLRSLEPAQRVFLYGRGRSGLVARAFAVRLMHLGFQTFVVGETITAPVHKNDVVILVSGSGQTYPVVMTAELGRKMGAKVVSVTANTESEIARLSHVVIPLIPPAGDHGEYAPLGSLFETAAWLFFDGVVAMLKQQRGESEAAMRERHATLE
jgi:6-phospho 3-hexuloisomerase